jgi:Rieske Fe-S protein
LSRITKGATIGALGVSGISIGYLLTTAPLKPPVVRKNPLPQVPNTAQIFTNPHNGREGLFIRLPNGKLVAFDRACTHRGVYVDYDPKTHMLICPAHEAIFDPANGARVVQGPATIPLPPVPFHLKDDGTLLIGESDDTSREEAL